MQRRTRQMGHGRLQGVEAIVERQEGVSAEGHDGRLLFGREDGRARLLGPHRGSLDGLALAPLGDRLAIEAVLHGEGAHGLLGALEGSSGGVRGAGAAV